MKVDGACHCGYIRYEAQVEPESVTICHCTDCQTLSGTAFRVVAPAKAGSFRLLAGRLKAYVKTAESGNRRLQSFCPECGTPIYSASPGEQPPIYLRIGAIKQREQLAPRTQIWARSAQRWLGGLTSIARVEKQG
jgi:hypothetical protein